MSRRTGTLAPGYFEALYGEKPDPWGFASSAYERAKYEHTLQALPRAHYREALEVGCSIGVFTAMLAARCARLTAIDAAQTCLDAARGRCADIAHVAFERMFVPGDWPEGRFDLLVLSEVVYYLEAADVARLAQRVVRSLTPGGTVALAHWVGLTDYPLSGDEAAELFLAALPEDFAVRAAERRAQYRLDVVVRRA